MVKLILAIVIGSSLGGLFRWFLSLKFNIALFTIPLGTLLSNLIAGYIIGIAIAFFNAFPSFSPEWRLLIITGFCGGLSTFSTFSAEILHFLQQGRMAWGLASITIHVVGSVWMTFLGMVSYNWLRS